MHTIYVLYTLQHTTSSHRLACSCPFPHTTAYSLLLHTHTNHEVTQSYSQPHPLTHLLLKLLPAVGPSPVVSLVQAIPHSHHLIATVIEDGSESSREETENCTATEDTDLRPPLIKIGNLVSQETCKGHTLHGMNDRHLPAHVYLLYSTFKHSCENVAQVSHYSGLASLNT